MSDVEALKAEARTLAEILDEASYAHSAETMRNLVKALSDAETQRDDYARLNSIRAQDGNTKAWEINDLRVELVEANRKLEALEERAEKSMPELGQSLSNARKHRALTAEHALVEANRKLEAYVALIHRMHIHAEAHLDFFDAAEALSVPVVLEKGKSE